MPHREFDFDPTPFRILIRKRSGLIFDDTRLTSLVGGIAQRMSANGIVSPEQYHSILLNDGEELQRLFNLLTVNETYFFREPLHFQVLTENLLPELRMDRAPGSKIRILCAGCSTGEEPYTVIISLIEKFGQDILRFISVTGIDIDTNVLDKAKRGIYTATSFRDVPSAIVDKYFEPHDNGRRRIKDFVRGNVAFLKVNLFSPEERGRLQDSADIIFYRNVSIYFDSDTQKIIFSHLADMLRGNSYLFVSATETLSHNSGILPLIERNGIFLFHKPPVRDACAHFEHQSAPERNCPLLKRSRPIVATPEGAMASLHRMSQRKTVAPVPVQKSAQPATVQHAARLGKEIDVDAVFNAAVAKSLEKNYTCALAAADRLILHDGGFIRAYTLKALIFLNQQHFEESRRAALKALEIDEFCLEAHLLLGLAAKQVNDHGEAFRRFRDALYVESACWLAHYFLAEIHVAQGEFEKAGREFEIVIKILGRDNYPAAVASLIQFSVPPDQLVHLCNQKISELKSYSKRAANGV